MVAAAVAATLCHEFSHLGFFLVSSPQVQRLVAGWKRCASWAMHGVICSEQTAAMQPVCYLQSRCLSEGCLYPASIASLGPMIGGFNGGVSIGRQFGVLASLCGSSLSRPQLQRANKLWLGPRRTADERHFVCLPHAHVSNAVAEQEVAAQSSANAGPSENETADTVTLGRGKMLGSVKTQSSMGRGKRLGQHQDEKMTDVLEGRGKTSHSARSLQRMKQTPTSTREPESASKSETYSKSDLEHSVAPMASRNASGFPVRHIEEVWEPKEETLWRQKSASEASSKDERQSWVDSFAVANAEERRARSLGTASTSGRGFEYPPSRRETLAPQVSHRSAPINEERGMLLQGKAHGGERSIADVSGEKADVIRGAGRRASSTNLPSETSSSGFAGETLELGLAKETSASATWAAPESSLGPFRNSQNPPQSNSASNHHSTPPTDQTLVKTASTSASGGNESFSSLGHRGGSTQSRPARVLVNRTTVGGGNSQAEAAPQKAENGGGLSAEGVKRPYFRNMFDSSYSLPAEGGLGQVGVGNVGSEKMGLRKVGLGDGGLGKVGLARSSVAAERRDGAGLMIAQEGRPEASEVLRQEKRTNGVLVGLSSSEAPAALSSGVSDTANLALTPIPETTHRTPPDTAPVLNPPVLGAPVLDAPVLGAPVLNGPVLNTLVLNAPLETQILLQTPLQNETLVTNAAAVTSASNETIASLPTLRKPPAMKLKPGKGKPKSLTLHKPAQQSQSSATTPGGRSSSGKNPPSGGGLTLDAVVRRIVYENPDTGYVIARVKAVGNLSSSGAHLPGNQFDPSKQRGGKKQGKSKGENLVTVVGTLPKLAEGQPLQLIGNWRDNAKFGREFVATRCQELEVSSLPDLITYLGGGSLPKVGPVRAAAIVDAYGDQTLKMLDGPDAVRKLQQVPGIGRSTASEIKGAWEERRGVRKIMDFLQLHGVPAAAAQRIVRLHREDTEAIVRADPWDATSGIQGFGFEKADALAYSMGTCPSLIGRRTAAIRAVLTSVCGSEGHVFLPWNEVRTLTAQLLTQTGRLTDPGAGDEGWGVEPDREALEQGLRVLVRNEKVVVEAEGEIAEQERVERWTGDGARCYLPALHDAEVSLARNVKRRLDFPPDPSKPDLLADVSMDTLSAGQREAVENAVTSPMLILTGGPGTGKTHTLKTIVALWQNTGKAVLCCAPTGRASQRLSESVGIDAKTIHRLLEYKFGYDVRDGSSTGKSEKADVKPTGYFSRDSENLLKCDALVVDEVSMLDLPLAEALFSAVPPNAQILLVGDIDQLPPVGPGHVLRDIINSNRVPVCRLTEVFRQAQQSAIVRNAHAINRGRFPNLELTQSKPLPKPQTSRPQNGPPGAPEGSNAELFESSERDGVIALRSSIVESDCLWINVPDHMVPTTLKEIISPGGLLSQLEIDPRKDVQVLSPMKKGAAGTAALNRTIQGLVNPPGLGKGELEYRQAVYRTGDRVIQTANDYDRMVFNGDLGTVSRVDQKKEVAVRFRGSEAMDILPPGSSTDGILYGPQMNGGLACLEDLLLAWAITVHKSQGSEYPVVLLPVSQWHNKMLSRKLLYTGLTRARKLAVIIGPRGAIETAVATITDDDRYTYLRQRLLQS